MALAVTEEVYVMVVAFTDALIEDTGRTLDELRPALDAVTPDLYHLVMSPRTWLQLARAIEKDMPIPATPFLAPLIH